MTEKTPSLGDAPAKAEARNADQAKRAEQARIDALESKNPRLATQFKLDAHASKEAEKPVTFLPFERRVVAFCKAEDYPGGVEMLVANLSALHRWAQYRDVTAEQFTKAVQAIEDVRFR